MKTVVRGSMPYSRMSACATARFLALASSSAVRAASSTDTPMELASGLQAVRAASASRCA